MVCAGDGAYKRHCSTGTRGDTFVKTLAGRNTATNLNYSRCRCGSAFLPIGSDVVGIPSGASSHRAPNSDETRTAEGAFEVGLRSS